MNFYLYLEKKEYADAWVNGGLVPFFSSSKYKREERGGIYTPDENLIDQSTFDIKEIANSIRFQGEFHEQIRFVNCFDNGRMFSGVVNRSYEDGLVICLSVKRSKFIARQLGKKACVKINDLERLKNCVDDFTGGKALEGLCKYTPNHERNHFLKSTFDEWQKEYRLFWNGIGEIEIQLPPGIATLEFVLP